MNKTIIININGIVFHIEEDAYEVLKSYMTEVKRHFAYSNDSDEIVTDIENRLAEMFNEKLAEQNKQVIILADVEEVTAQMGKASDFDLNEEDDTFDARKIKSPRTLYKDSDDRMIGGVCAGLGHYFDIEVKWVRLITLLLTLFSGIGLIPYLVLWIVLPTARSRQERMAMKGEAINLQNFKKTFDEETETTKTYNDTTYNPPYQRINSNDPIREIVAFIGKAVKVFLKIIVGIIIVLDGFVLLALIVGLVFGLGFINHTGFQEFPFNAVSHAYRAPIIFSIFLITIIPLLALIFFALRVLLNRKVLSRYGAFAMLMLWITGIAMGVYYGSSIAADFREEAKFEQISDLNPYPVLTLKLDHKLFFTSEDSLKYNIDSGKIRGHVIYGDNNLSGEMKRYKIFIEKSDNDKLTLIKELSGRGRNFERALEAAQRISYQVIQQDSVINFHKYWSLSGNGIYRGQELKLHLKVPVNTRLLIEGDMNDRIYSHNSWQCREDREDYERPAVWVMTEEGLKCADEELERKRNE
ncbi:MAG: PspC domain-containing protein [Sphingobacteriaceae bacterium]|nr:PspC domain-containing protein [Sphingobacteriaceae bacterium]